MLNGTASTPPRYLKSNAFPSMTGCPAAGPMSPSPRTRVPSLTTAMVLARLVCLNDSAGSASIALQLAATPGVYQTPNAEKSQMLHLGTT